MYISMMKTCCCFVPIGHNKKWVWSTCDSTLVLVPMIVTSVLHVFFADHAIFITFQNDTKPADVRSQRSQIRSYWYY